MTGIGVEVNPEPVAGGIEIEEVFQGSPAAKGRPHARRHHRCRQRQALSGKTVGEGSKLIKGHAGTAVVLTIRRDGKTHNARLVRRTVTVPVASSKLIHYRGHRLGYLQFTQFTQGSARQLRAQVRRMLNKHPAGLILDLRDNGGGLLAASRGGRQHLHRGRHDRYDPRTQPADARLPRQGQRDRAANPDGRAGRPRHRLVG